MTCSPHGYDPRDDGARCDYCPLGPNGPLRDPSFPFSPVRVLRLRAAGVARMIAEVLR
jgi:hypothetical protein